MKTDDIKDVLDNVRPGFEFNVGHVAKYLQGTGLDMGCGSCPLLLGDCYHIDISPQPLCEEQVPEGRFIQADAVAYVHSEDVDFIFSSHMVEDLESIGDIINCLNDWSRMIKPEGHMVLLLPDMQGGRYYTVAEGGNPSHRVDVGKDFVLEIMPMLPLLRLIQLDTIPHNKSCTIDVVFKRVTYGV